MPAPAHGEREPSEEQRATAEVWLRDVFRDLRPSSESLLSKFLAAREAALVERVREECARKRSDPKRTDYFSTKQRKWVPIPRTPGTVDDDCGLLLDILAAWRAEQDEEVAGSLSAAIYCSNRPLTDEERAFAETLQPTLRPSAPAAPSERERALLRDARTLIRQIEAGDKPCDGLWFGLGRDIDAALSAGESERGEK